MRSPSGGLHYWYSGKHVFALGKNGIGKDIDSPNYVLLPGCKLASGGEYTLIDDYPLTEAPDWFYEYYLRDRGGRGQIRRKRLPLSISIKTQIPNGQFTICATMRRTPSKAKAARRPRLR